VHVPPINPTLKLPGAKRLKLNCDEPLSTSAFKFKLHPYNWVHLVAEDVFGNLQTEAVLLPWRGGVLRTNTRPTLNRRTESARTYEHLP
jgi:hypothetical protein